MKNLHKLLKYLLLSGLLFAVFPAIHADEIGTLRSRLYNEYYSSTTADVNMTFLSSQQSDGKWTDIVYTDKSITNWDPIKHLQRIRSIAKSYCDQTDKTSATAVSLLAGIEKGLTAWYSGGYKSDNWFFNDIGQQRELGPILALVYNYLQPTTVSTACNYLIVNGNPTLTNLVWEAAGVLIKGAVLNNISYIKQGVAYFHTALTPTAKNVEGIQKDLSYLFHGLQVYNGGYGTWMITDVTLWMNMLSGLSFGFQASDIEPLRNLLLQGDQWMIRRGQYDFGSAGRDISRQSGLSSSGNKTNVTRMLAIDPANATSYQNFINHMNGTNNGSLTGNKMFFRADYMVQKRSAYHLSVKMCSSRTSGTEYMNGENAKGFWLPFGATCLMKDAGEYATVFPLWDWTRIPGTTATAETPTFGTTLNQATTFVGGVTNGQCGVAAMELNKQGLTAKKSWFMFDNETVCLGAGISSTNANIVNTTIAQSQLRGSVRVDNVTKSSGTDATCSNAKWVYHDNVCYFFPIATTVLLTNTSKTGSWSTINTSQSTTPLTDNVFNLIIPHNLKPSNASYAYIIRPDILPLQVQAYSENLPVNILANSSVLQAVTQNNQKLTGAVFFTNGNLIIDSGLTVTVDQPCVLLIDQSSEPVSVTVSDPSQTKTTVNVTLKYASYPSETLSFNLPTGDMTGSSLTKSAQTFRKENYQGILITRKPYLPLSVTDTFAIKQVANCSSCTTTTINWVSSNTSVATVDNNGIISAIGNGNATLTATLSETGQSASCDIQIMNKDINEQFGSTARLTIIPNGGNWSASANILSLTSPVGSTVASPEKNMALVSTPVKGDFVIACNMLVEETTSTWNDFCVVWNHQYPANSYFYAHLCENNDNAGSGIFKLIDGVKSAEITDITTPLVAGIWHEVALKATGTQAKVYLDGTLVATTACDSNRIGLVGVGSYNDGCRFSNLRVWQTDNLSALIPLEKSKIKLRLENHQLIVLMPETLSRANISVYDGLGRKLAASKISGGTQSFIQLPVHFSGMAIIAMETPAGLYRNKLIIH